MAGQLVQVATNTISSAVSSVTLTGIDDDSVYLFTWVGVTCASDVNQNQIRITKSGTAQSDSEYDFASEQLFASTSFVSNGQVNQTSFIDLYIGNSTGEMANGLMYLHNFNNSSEFSFVTREQVSLSHVAQAQGVMGGGVHTVASASDGVNYFMASGNLTGGTFTLYKVV
tara:strand:- start:2202 stop:2711 length:510 start_codon:yes stop_codon:yes gene_type:complete